MDEARLTEIEECMCYEPSSCCDRHPELIAEIRRLKITSPQTWVGGYDAAIEDIEEIISEKGDEHALQAIKDYLSLDHNITKTSSPSC